MFRRLPLLWKLSLIAALIPLCASVGLQLSLRGTRTIQAEYSTLYRLMLLPILALDEAQTRRERLAAGLRELTRPELPSERRLLLGQQLREDDRAMAAALARYRQEWLAPLTPGSSVPLEFLELKAQEQNALQLFEASYGTYAPLRERLLAGAPVAMAELDTPLADMGSAMSALVAFNRQLADLSNTRVQAASEQMVSQLQLAGVLLSLAGLAVAWAVSRAIARPLEQLRRLLSRLSRGEAGPLKDEAQALHEAPHGRDAVAALLSTAGELLRSTEQMAAAVHSLSQGEVSARIELRSEQDALGNALNQLMTRMSLLLTRLRGSIHVLKELSARLAFTSGERTESVSDRVMTAAMAVEDLQAGLLLGLLRSARLAAEHSQLLAEQVLQRTRDAALAEQAGQLARTCLQHSAGLAELDTGMRQVGDMIERVWKASEDLSGMASEVTSCTEALQQLSAAFHPVPGDRLPLAQREEPTGSAGSSRRRR